MLLWVAGLGFDGAGDRNRTYDLRVTSALLYRLSYTGLTIEYLCAYKTASTHIRKTVAPHSHRALLYIS